MKKVGVLFVSMALVLGLVFYFALDTSSVMEIQQGFTLSSGANVPRYTPYTLRMGADEQRSDAAEVPLREAESFANQRAKTVVPLHAQAKSATPVYKSRKADKNLYASTNVAAGAQNSNYVVTQQNSNSRKSYVQQTTMAAVVSGSNGVNQAVSVIKAPTGFQEISNDNLNENAARMEATRAGVTLPAQPGSSGLTEDNKVGNYTPVGGGVGAILFFSLLFIWGKGRRID